MQESDTEVCADLINDCLHQKDILHTNPDEKRQIQHNTLAVCSHLVEIKGNENVEYERLEIQPIVPF